MRSSDSPKVLSPGDAAVIIPFPEPGEWLEVGQSRDLGAFERGVCSGNLFKTADNQLYVFLRVMGKPDHVVKAYMPLIVPDAGESTLHIHWEETLVRLWQDSRPAIDADWLPRA